MQTYEEATVYVKELDIFLTLKVFEDTPAVLPFGKLHDEHGCSYEWINCQKPHLIKNGIRIQCNTANFVSIVLVYQRVLSPVFPLQHPWHLQDRKLIILRLPQDCLSHQSWLLQLCQDSYSAAVSSKHVERQERGDLPFDIPEWLQKFLENLVDDRVPECRDSHASSSREPSLDPTRSADLGKLCSYSLPLRPKLRDLREDQNYKGRLQQITKFSVMLVNFETIIDMQWWRKTWPPDGTSPKQFSQETQRSLRKFLEPKRKPKVIHTDKSLEFGKACEDLSWNHCTSTPHRSETNGIAERAVRRIKEGTSAVWLPSSLDENSWTDSMECYTFLRNIQDLVWENSIRGPIMSFGSLVEYYRIFANDRLS